MRYKFATLLGCIAAPASAGAIQDRLGPIVYYHAYQECMNDRAALLSDTDQDSPAMVAKRASALCVEKWKQLVDTLYDGTTPSTPNALQVERLKTEVEEAAETNVILAREGSCGTRPSNARLRC